MTTRRSESRNIEAENEPIRDDGRDIIIVSDLHMSEGRHDASATFDRKEDFFYDDAFERFVNYLTENAYKKKRKLRLIILGDFVDFLQVDPKKNNHSENNAYETDNVSHIERKPCYSISDTSSQAAVKKLEIIKAGHRVMFETLNRFVRGDHHLHIVLGNHDIEFVFLEVQEHFKELVLEDKDADSTYRERITFHPWVFYVPGVVYADHGHQYDAMNSFANQLSPYLPSDSQEKTIELPLGSFFVLHLFNHIEESDPFADNIKPSTLYMRWALRNRPSRILKAVLWLFIVFCVWMWKTVIWYWRWRWKMRIRHWWRKKSEPERAEETREQGANEDPAKDENEFEPKREVVKKIHDNVTKAMLVHDHKKQLGILLLAIPGLGSLLVFSLFVIVSSVKKWLISPLKRLFFWPFSERKFEVRESPWNEWLSFKESGVKSYNYLFDAAKKIHVILTRNHAQVPVYVFGHTHHAEQYLLEKDNKAPRYINSGTWTPIIPDRFDLLGKRELFTFVELHRDEESGEMVSELKLWNDAAGRPEPLTRLREAKWSPGDPPEPPRGSSRLLIFATIAALLSAIFILLALGAIGLWLFNG